MNTILGIGETAAKFPQSATTTESLRGKKTKRSRYSLSAGIRMAGTIMFGRSAAPSIPGLIGLKSQLQEQTRQLCLPGCSRLAIDARQMGFKRIRRYTKGFGSFGGRKTVRQEQGYATLSWG